MKKYKINYGVGERLSIFREQTKLSQQSLSEKSGVLQASISQAENNVVFPSFRLLTYLIDNHNLNVKWLITGIGDPMIHPLEAGPDVGLNQIYRKLFSESQTNYVLGLKLLELYHDYKRAELFEKEINGVPIESNELSFIDTIKSAISAFSQNAKNKPASKAKPKKKCLK